jgi:beta-glucosidase
VTTSTQEAIGELYFPGEIEHARKVLRQLTLEEKASFLAGVDDWHFRGIPRLNVPSVRVTDCGHGVTLCGDRSSPATCFPTGIGMASTWNEALLEKAGAALGRETRALGCSVLLGPKINLHRIPLNGRSFETFSEDPVLAGHLGAALIRGIQSEEVGACVKAVAGNNQQKDQDKISAEIDERTLRELYLRGFEIAVESGRPAMIMTSYNALNGDLTSESKWLLQEVIKGDWQFPGPIVSDWRAVRTSKVYGSGLDLEMPGPGKLFNTQAVLQAMQDGHLFERDLDDKVGRILRLVLKYGQDENVSAAVKTLLDTPENRTIALAVAEESIVLLKNENQTLPLDRNQVRRLLVFGPNAAEARLGGGGSASVTPFYSVSPLQGLREIAGPGVEVEYLEGCSLVGTMAPIREGLEHQDDKGRWISGLKAEFFNHGQISGQPDAAWTVEEVNFSWGWAAPGPGVLRSNYAVRFSGRVVPPVTGRYRVGVFGQEGCLRLFLNGKRVYDAWPTDANFEDDYVTRYSTVDCDFVGGEPVEIVMEYGKRAARGAVRLEWEVPGRRADPIQNAAAAARRADAVVVCAGLSNLFEGGSRDRTDLDLPEMQQRLIEAVAAENRRTIVVLVNGGPLIMPWEPKVSALLEAWYSGQEGGRALAKIIFGDTNPSGRLPDTLAHRLEDHASARNYPGDGERVTYEEGLSIGYRHFDSAGIEPHFPFGFGLSYTSFEIGPPMLEAKSMPADGEVRIKTSVTNTGGRTGKEVVQLYVRPPASAVPRPDKELRAFQKVELEPGETKELTFTLTSRDFAFYDTTAKRWRVLPGVYEILVGPHSRRLQGAPLTITDRTSSSEAKQ